MSLHLSKYHIVGNHMSRLIFIFLFLQGMRNRYSNGDFKNIDEKIPLRKNIYILDLLNKNICKKKNVTI